MIVCHCTAVSDRTVAQAIAAGARDEFDVARACGAGSICGGCVPTVSRLLRSCGGGPVEAGHVEAVEAVEALQVRPALSLPRPHV